MRHGESYSNISGKMVSSQDTELTSKGITQSEAARDFLNINFDYIFSSPLKRAKQTAEILAGNTPIQIYDDLREMEVGLLEGKTWAELEEQFPDVDSGRGLSSVSFPQGENFEDILGRCRSFIDQALTNLPTDANVLIACHGIIKRVLVNALLNKPRECVDHLNWCDNTAFTLIDMTDTPKIIHLNHWQHLEADNLRTEGFHTWGHLSEQDYTLMN